MKYKINAKGDLIITTGPQDQEAIRGMLEAGKPACQHEAGCLESLIANSELEWLPEGVTGDLTSAPMLGILGDVQTEEAGPHGALHVGCWDDKDRYQPVVQRWAFMDYAVRSFVEDLLEHGECVFQGGYEEAA